jgi:chorismate mutase
MTDGKADISREDAPGLSEAMLSPLREGIDAIDDAMLDLIVRRQALARRINALKPPPDETLKLRPDREAHVVGRLVARAAPEDRRLVLALWREIMGAGLAAQTELTVITASPTPSIRHAARLRFGVSARYRSDTPEAALRAAQAEPAVVVLDPADGTAWWTALPGMPDLWIFDRLELEGGRHAFAVGRVRPDSLVQGLGFQVIAQTAEPPGERIVAWAGDMMLIQTAEAQLDRADGWVGSAPRIG